MCIRDRSCFSFFHQLVIRRTYYVKIDISQLVWGRLNSYIFFSLDHDFPQISFISMLNSSSSFTLSTKLFQIFKEIPLYLETFNFPIEIIRYAPLFGQQILTLKPFTMPGMA